MSLLLTKLSPRTGKYEFIGTFLDDNRESWLRANLPPGTYTATCRANWESFSDQATICLYGPGHADIKEISPRSLPKNFYEQVFIHKASTYKDIKTYPEIDPDIYYKVDYMSTGFMYFYFVSTSFKHNAEFTLKFNIKKNISPSKYLSESKS